MRLYESLCKIFYEINNIDNIISLLEWDIRVAMPRGAAEDRAKQINTLSSIKHDMLTSSAVTNLIQESIKQSNKLKDWQKSDLIEMERIHNNTKIIPINLLHEFNNAVIASNNAWEEGKKENKFKTWLPKLQELVKITREIATIKAEFLGCSKYEALLDNYEAQLDVATIDATCAEVGKFLGNFIDVVLEKQPKINPTDKIFPIEKQRELSKEIMQLMNLPEKNLRIDESIHPFSIGNQFDSRITTTYNEKDFIKGFASTLHECGHALYNLNLPVEFYGHPVGSHLGMAVHESQALLFQKQIGSSPELINYMIPIFKRIFKGKSWSANNILNAINKVSKSPIRIYADEVTYPVHIMIRYSLEKAIIEGELEVEDLPQAWAEDMKHYLNITPTNDAEGCMQDIHWSLGEFGYFPCYLLGMIMSAQIFAKIKEQHPNTMKQITNGDLSIVINWLKNNIYKHGKKYSAQQLMQNAVNENINPKYYITYLQDKYCNPR